MDGTILANESFVASQTYYYGRVKGVFYESRRLHGVPVDSLDPEIIEKYSDDKYSPSCLIYGVTMEGRILHVLSNSQGVIITVYEPNLTKWCEDMKTRRL